MSHLKGGSANRFITAMTSTLSSGPAAGQILQAYGITKDMADEEAFSAIVNYINDISFFAPVLSFAQGWPGNVYVYYFNEGNPWDGPWKGRASHILDLAYLFQNFQEYMTPTQRAVGTAFAEDIFKFCHGVAPWSPTTGISLSGGFVARTYGPSEKSTIGEVKEPFGGESLRRRTLFDHPDVSLDELARVLAVFKAM